MREINICIELSNSKDKTQTEMTLMTLASAIKKTQFSIKALQQNIRQKEIEH
jgi:hypothetical protein